MTTTPDAPATDTPAAARQSAAGSAGTAGTAVLVLATLLSLAVLGLGVYLAAREITWAVLAAGAASTVASLLAWPIVRGLASLGSSMGVSDDRLEDALRPVRHNTDAAVRLLTRIESSSGISERAKQVAHREQDRDAIRRAIEEDLRDGDYAGAQRLADEMQNSFGYADEAERVRDEVRTRVAGERERAIGDARANVERLCREEKWGEAFSVSDRAISRFSGDMEVKLLRTRIEERRQNKKVELVQKFHAAVERKDVDEAAELIRRLDSYLTADEGRQLAESAREVFKNRLLKLRDQFSGAMQGHDYSEAIRVGEIIKRDFPNSQLAKEVRDHEPRVREAAGVASED